MHKIMPVQFLNPIMSIMEYFSRTTAREADEWRWGWIKRHPMESAALGLVPFLFLVLVGRPL
jgi:hypothetical protein